MNMQRKVKGLNVTVAHSEFDENGEVQTRIFTVKVYETDEKKAVKYLTKTCGDFQALKFEKFEQLYFLDDDTFFKYAVPVEE